MNNCRKYSFLHLFNFIIIYQIKIVSNGHLQINLVERVDVYLALLSLRSCISHASFNFRSDWMVSLWAMQSPAPVHCTWPVLCFRLSTRLGLAIWLILDLVSSYSGAAATEINWVYLHDGTFVYDLCNWDFNVGLFANVAARNARSRSLILVYQFTHVFAF